MASIVSGILLVSFVLVIEMVAPEKRVFCGMVFKMYATVGQVLISGLGYWFKDWRTAMIVAVVPAFLLLLYWPFLPESVRSVPNYNLSLCFSNNALNRI